ncbi:MAG: aldehyde dehydrogenase family protein, partial [Anaerolineales bacterium]
MKALLKKLGIEAINPGACGGPDRWIKDPKGKELVSYNPTNDQPIAKVIQATAKSYQELASHAQQAFLSWREVPAPKRGQVVRDLGNA